MTGVSADIGGGAAGRFETLLQREVEKAVWALEAARTDLADAEVSIGQIARIVCALRDVAGRAGYPLVAALCDSACSLAMDVSGGRARQRGLREHLNALRNIVIAGMQNRGYGSIDQLARPACF
jgi:hypothetical protein